MDYPSGWISNPELNNDRSSGYYNWQFQLANDEAVSRSLGQAFLKPMRTILKNYLKLRNFGGKVSLRSVFLGDKIVPSIARATEFYGLFESVQKTCCPTFVFFA